VEGKEGVYTNACEFRGWIESMMSGEPAPPPAPSGEGIPRNGTGSCLGLCGEQGSGACFCDEACEATGDCCSDFVAMCACDDDDDQPSAPTFAATMSPTEMPPESPTEFPESPTEFPEFPESPTEFPEFPEFPESPTEFPEFPEFPESPTEFPEFPEFPESPTEFPEFPEFPESPTEFPEFPEFPESPTEFPIESPTESPTEFPESPEFPEFPIESPTDCPSEPPTESPTSPVDEACPAQMNAAGTHLDVKLWDPSEWAGKNDYVLSIPLTMPTLTLGTCVPSNNGKKRLQTVTVEGGTERGGVAIALSTSLGSKERWFHGCHPGESMLGQDMKVNYKVLNGQGKGTFKIPLPRNGECGDYIFQAVSLLDCQFSNLGYFPSPA